MIGIVASTSTGVSLEGAHAAHGLKCKHFDAPDENDLRLHFPMGELLPPGWTPKLTCLSSKRFSSWPDAHVDIASLVSGDCSR